MSPRAAYRAPGAEPAGEAAVVRVRAWDVVVRATHWIIAVAIVVLAATGLYIGHPLSVGGPASGRFVMGVTKVVHDYAAIAFTLAVLSRILWMFVGKGHARWTEFVPVQASRRVGMLQTFAFYTFLRRTPAASVGHNPLAGASYIAVFGLYLVMIATGLGLYAVDVGAASALYPLHALLAPFGGAQTARWVHHVVMWLLLGFVVHHVYSATLTSVVERNGTMDSIFSGNKFVSRELADSDRAPEGKR